MNIYLIESTLPFEYDTYDSIIVVEDTEEKALSLCDQFFDKKHSALTLVGIANINQEKGILITSFNAG